MIGVSEGETVAEATANAAPPTGEGAMDSREAARRGARLLLIAIGIGIVCGLATFVFLAVEHYGIVFFWETLPEIAEGALPSWVLAVAVVAVMTALAAVVVALVGKRPFDMGAAEAEYDAEGRMGYRHVLAGAVFSLFSLFSGAAVGPEAPLTDINGGIGTFIADSLKLEPRHVKAMTYAGVAGAFGAFFGSAPVGALLAAELISPKVLNISRTQILAGLGSGAAGWVVFQMLGGHQLAPLFTFAGLEGGLRLVDLAFALALGALGGGVGLVYGKGLMQTRLGTQKLRTRPWLAALAGGVPIALAAVFAPRLLFSGTDQVGPVIEGAATLGIVALLVMGVAKLALSGWSMSTAYFGGAIFPVILAGTCFGLAISQVFPSWPQGVVVLSLLTGMTVAAAVAPLSVTLLISLLADPVFAPAIAVAAVSAFVVRQFLAPTLPGIYRATRHAEDRRAAAGVADAG